MAAKAHEYLVNIFDSVTDALDAEKNGHYIQVLCCIGDMQLELQKAETLVLKIQERNELRASKA